MRDIIPPAVARAPAEAVELAAVAISDGDLEAAVAQYEQDAGLRVWRERADADVAAETGLAAVMELRLPVDLQVRAVLPGTGFVLVLAERRISGAGPECQRIELRGAGAAVVRQQPGGGWRIAADAWSLAGPGSPADPPEHPADSPEPAARLATGTKDGRQPAAGRPACQLRGEGPDNDVS